MFDSTVLDDFSQRWAEALFRRYPELQDIATADKGALSVEWHSPVAGRSLWITTTEGEVMITFAPTYWHDHFGKEDWRGTETDQFEDALALIDGIINERIVFTEWINAGGSRVTTSIPESEADKATPSPTKTMFSWRGTYDRAVR